MTKKRRLTEVEWELMDGVWRFDRQSAVRDVVNHLYPNGEKAYTTVQTIMNILAEKDRRYLIRPRKMLCCFRGSDRRYTREESSMFPCQHLFVFLLYQTTSWNSGRSTSNRYQKIMLNQFITKGREKRVKSETCS